MTAVGQYVALTPTAGGRPAPRAPEEEPYEPVRALLSHSAAPETGKTSTTRTGPARVNT